MTDPGVRMPGYEAMLVWCVTPSPSSIGNFPSEQIEWQKLLALACTALEKVSWRT